MNLPWRWGYGDPPRPLTDGEACAVLGNANRWADIKRNSTVGVDTIWRSTPLVLRKKIIGEVFGTYDMVCMDAYQFGTIPREELVKQKASVHG